MHAVGVNAADAVGICYAAAMAESAEGVVDGKEAVSKGEGGSRCPWRAGRGAADREGEEGRAEGRGERLRSGF